MKDIKYLDTDGDYLVLENSDGQKYRLVIDDALRRAIRNESVPRLDGATITPREIQEEIRVGRTIDEIIRSSGASEEYVRKFAQPVLDELNHAVLNALTVRLEVAGDRFNEPTAREFGEIIKMRLAASGAGIERWSAMKAPDSGFFIYCEFEHEGETKKATWSYDPKRLSLAPENQLAITLSSQDRISQPVAPRLRPVDSPSTSITENLAATIDLVPDLPTPTKSQPSDQITSQPPLSETADLLEALRKKRSERESVEDLKAHPNTETVRVIHIESQPVNEIEPEEAPPPKKGRSSIPSWDEIVFGTKPEDE